jgi:hypothetical protein
VDTAAGFTIQWTVGERISQGTVPVVTGSGPSLPFTPSDPGVYVVTATVTDKDGGVRVDVRQITVANVAPTAVPWPNDVS